jgi:hypothetical protein
MYTLLSRIYKYSYNVMLFAIIRSKQIAKNHVRNKGLIDYAKLFYITALPELCRVSVDLSSHTEQFLNDIILYDSILTRPSPSASPSSVPLFPPHDQWLVELLVPLCPAYWMQVLPEGAIEG